MPLHVCGRELSALHVLRQGPTQALIHEDASIVVSLTIILRKLRPLEIK